MSESDSELARRRSYVKAYLRRAAAYAKTGARELAAQASPPLPPPPLFLSFSLSLPVAASLPSPPPASKV